MSITKKKGVEKKGVGYHIHALLPAFFNNPVV